MEDPEGLDSLRNEAVAAWLQPSADEGRLQAFLARLDPDRRAGVEQSARAVRAALESFMSRPFAGDEDACLVAAAVRAHLTPGFPWLRDEALRALVDHIDWIAGDGMEAR